MMPRVLTSGVINLMGLRIELTRHWRCKKYYSNANWCYVLSQVDIKLINKDLREWVTGIQ